MAQNTEGGEKLVFDDQVYLFMDFTSSNVTGSESDDQLFALGAFGPRFGHHVLINSLNGPLEAGELHHGVRDLTTP